VYFAAELRILLVYLSESLGRLGQNGEGALGATFFIGGVHLAPVEPPLAHTHTERERETERKSDEYLLAGCNDIERLTAIS